MVHLVAPSKDGDPKHILRAIHDRNKDGVWRYYNCARKLRMILASVNKMMGARIIAQREAQQ